MKDRIIKKIQSPVVWASFIALVAQLLINMGLTDIASKAEIVMQFVLDAIILFGILNNCDTREHF